MPRNNQHSKAASTFIEEKVSDLRLRTFALGNSSLRRNVLIELDLPKPKVRVTGKRKIGGRSVARKQLALSPTDRRRRKHRISQVVNSLKDLGATLNVLESSGVVVTKLQAGALCQIAKSDLVRAIHPNRKRKLRM